jgi:hypothetical protein
MLEHRRVGLGTEDMWLVAQWIVKVRPQHVSQQALRVQHDVP